MYEDRHRGPRSAGSVPEVGSDLLSRRQVIERAAIGGASLTALSGLLAACGGRDGAPGTSTASLNAPSVRTSKVVGIATAESQPLDLDQAVNGSAAAMVTVGNIHAFLLGYDRSGRQVPDLAESVERVAPTKVRATLRSGLTFHDGSPVRPADVIYSFARLQDPRTASQLLENLKPIKDMTARGNAVEFELDGPYPPFEAVAADVPIVPEGSGPQQKTDPIGAGAFKFVRWDKGNLIELAPFEDFYDPSQPRVGGLRFYSRPDAAALRSSFQSKQVAGALGFLWSDGKVLERAGGVVEGTPLLASQWMILNTKAKALTDPRVRQAISLAFDRAAMATAVSGPGVPANASVVPTASQYHSDAVAAPSADAARAKALLAEAGVEDLTIECLIPDLPDYRPAAPILQDLARQAGITLKVPVMGTAEVVNRVLVDKDFELTLWGDGGSDPATYLNRYLASDGVANASGYSNSKMDSLLNDARSTTDQGERTRLYEQVSKLVLQDNPIIFYSDVIAQTALHRDYTGMYLTPTGDLSVRTLGARKRS